MIPAAEKGLSAIQVSSGGERRGNRPVPESGYAPALDTFPSGALPDALPGWDNTETDSDPLAAWEPFSPIFAADDSGEALERTCAKQTWTVRTARGQIWKGRI
jgi:hypothetical protein